MSDSTFKLGDRVVVSAAHAGREGYIVRIACEGQIPPRLADDPVVRRVQSISSPDEIRKAVLS
jgi:hypothetical protein